jgi:hypothetical protein
MLQSATCGAGRLPPSRLLIVLSPVMWNVNFISFHLFCILSIHTRLDNLKDIELDNILFYSRLLNIVELPITNKMIPISYGSFFIKPRHGNTLLQMGIRSLNYLHDAK